MVVPRFWREIPARYNLIGVKCNKCNTALFPPREKCSKCGSLELDTYQMSGKGEIVTYTIIRSGTDQFKRDTPYVIAIVELDDGPRLTAQITDLKSFDDVEIGKKVRSCFRRVSEDGNSGAIYYGYKFKLVE